MPEIVGGCGVDGLRLARRGAGARECGQRRDDHGRHTCSEGRADGDPALSVCRAHLVRPLSVVHEPFRTSLPRERRVQAVFPRTLTKPVHTANLRPWISPAHARADRHPLAEPGGGGPPRRTSPASVPIPLVYGTDEALLYATERTDAPLVLLAGHLDTVPAQDNIPGRIEDGRVVGLGASDMKGGVAVMIELARWAAGSPTALDLAFLFFVREELPAEESALPRVFAEAPLVLESDLVVVLEPTDNAIHAGCLGNLNATLTFHGESAHSARPWQGVNAIDLAVEGLAPVVAVPPLEVEVGGLTFVEVLSATRIAGRNRLERHPRPGRGRAQLPLRAEPDARGGRGTPARAGRRGARDHVQLAARARRDRLAARPAPPRGRRSRARAEAGVDAGRGVRRPGPRRGQPRPGSDALRAQARRAGRDRRARAHVRDAAAVRKLAFGRAGLPRSRRPGHLPVRPDRAGQARGGRRRDRDPRLRPGRPARADRPADPAGARRRACAS